MTTIDETYMQMAIDLAIAAETQNEVPVGAVLLGNHNQVLAGTHNQTITLSDASAHAEILALREGGRKRSNYRLLDTTLYVTIEPCVMCMGALIHARVKRLVYGASDPKWGAAGSLYNFDKDTRMNHTISIEKGVCEDRCRHLIQAFFKKRRNCGNHTEKTHR